MNDKALIPKPLPTSNELIKAITHPKQLEFLDNYAKCNRRITKTAEAIGITEDAVHRWQRNDAVFRDSFLALKKELDTLRLEDYLDNIKEIAFDKSVPPQSRLLASFFEVKKLDPKYRDNQPNQGHIIGEIIVKTAVPRPEYDTVEGEYEEVT